MAKAEFAEVGPFKEELWIFKNENICTMEMYSIWKQLIQIDLIDFVFLYFEVLILCIPHV